MSEEIGAHEITETALAVTSEVAERELGGAERAAVLLLALGQEYGKAIWDGLDEIEVRQVSSAMASLGPVTPTMLEELFVDFLKRLSTRGALNGNVDVTERLLNSFLPSDRVAIIMEEIRGPAGRNMWEKLSNVPENVLANYLKNEYPQTIAVVLSKIQSDHAARVLALLNEELALDVVNRMLRMESIQKDILEKVEQTLRIEFMSNLSQTSRRDSHEMMADIFNNFDRQTEGRFLAALEEDSRESAERIRNLMFTFEDLLKLDSGACQTLLRNVEKDQLAMALKGASETAVAFFTANMSARAAKMLQEDMDNMGPVRLREVDEAQNGLVLKAKDLAAAGEITINKKKGEDELVY
ncbi:flagellar motor switch protein G [Pseudovibrio sp. FO-BEG1]|uniref:Flagellar motor switch protein FliG n=1 Tax=Pseudovibrio denitrificans TaxID=258256 RepID=A0A1I6Z7C3_9HYPH|nr:MULTISPECIES: flagellar motor switch protein FliG [Pseudovibrio]AEV38989.1 flagellar motor switch protein G [Pseudovibrio sp. FO-BEG1]EEA95592.1 flagellar motor switch protein FliG [Pseudovibrio sp. JE062]SFT58605.1 flagellar motor switch protein FliG [Pseudovibrio denitrificans]